MSYLSKHLDNITEGSIIFIIDAVIEISNQIFSSFDFSPINLFCDQFSSFHPIISPGKFYSINFNLQIPLPFPIEENSFHSLSALSNSFLLIERNFPEISKEWNFESIVAVKGTITDVFTDANKKKFRVLSCETCHTLLTRVKFHQLRFVFSY